VLSAAGIRLGFLSNLTEAMMEANIKIIEISK
jgi:hypothetical protein